eukprot:9345146-Pyramimonas_sp.AAC.1
MSVQLQNVGPEVPTPDEAALARWGHLTDNRLNGAVHDRGEELDVSVAQPRRTNLIGGPNALSLSQFR